MHLDPIEVKPPQWYNIANHIRASYRESPKSHEVLIAYGHTFAGGLSSSLQEIHLLFYDERSTYWLILGVVRSTSDAGMKSISIKELAREPYNVVCTRSTR